MYLVLLYPGLYLCVWHIFKDFIAFILIILPYDIKNKHFWPYTKYNNTCLN